MRQIERNTGERPGAHDAIIHGRLEIESEDANRRVVEPVHDTCSGGEVIEFLRDAKVTRVEQHAKGPAGQAKVSKQEVVSAQTIRRRNRLSQPAHAVVVGDEIHEREEHREGLLHAQKAVEWPFAVVLEDGLAVRWLSRQALVRHDVLAGVVAFGRAVPQQEAMLQR